MLFRYNLVDEDDIAGMKWKGEEGFDLVESRLIAAGFDPDELRQVLNQKNEETREKGG